MKYLLITLWISCTGFSAVAVSRFYQDSVLDENFLKIQTVLKAHEQRLDDIKPLKKVEAKKK